jgi:hypothetical protein
MNKTNLLYLQNGKIYKIVCNITNECYYGSTIQTLRHRLQIHEAIFRQYLKGKNNYYSVFAILERGDYAIELVENYGCLCRKQLEKIEGIYIKHYPCINKNVAGGDPDKEKANRMYCKQKYIKNKPYKKKYYKQNRNKIIQYNQKRYWRQKRMSFSKRNKKSGDAGQSIFSMLAIT